jgi:hypothetical protein
VAWPAVMVAAVAGTPMPVVTREWGEGSMGRGGVRPAVSAGGKTTVVGRPPSVAARGGRRGRQGAARRLEGEETATTMEVGGKNVT